MKQYTKLKVNELKNLQFKGLEILSVIESTNKDFKGIVIKDTITGTILDLRQGQYSDLDVLTEKQPKIVKKWQLTGTLEVGNLSAQFDTKAEAEEYVEKHFELTNPIIEEISVEVAE